MKLTKEQQYFLLTKFNILPDEVMDATSMKRSEWMKLIKDSEYKVAAGVDSCTKSIKHTIKSKSGHCIFCSPASISFQRRYSNNGDLYVMFSQSKKLIKVGVAASSEERESSLNQAAYGNIKDWSLKFSIYISKSGEAEKKVHNMLSAYHFPIKHGAGNSVFASEIFSCSVAKAVHKILLVAPHYKI
jgi:hypothetical protein